MANAQPKERERSQDPAQASPTFNYQIHTWNALDAYFAQPKILTQHQLESFNDWVDYVIPQIIERNNPIVIATDYVDNDKFKGFKKTYKITFLGTYLSKPLIQENNDVIKPLYPNEARLRGLTYAAPMFVDVRHTLTILDDDGHEVVRGDSTNTAVENKVPFFKIPVMLHSKYCHLSDRSSTTLKEMGECEFDQGGYFIINGGEKVLVAQERVAENKVFVWTPNKNANKYSHEAEIKSSIDQRFYPVKTNKVMLTKEPSAKAIKDAVSKGGVVGRVFRVKIPFIKDDVNLLIVFRALGVITEKEVYEMIFSDLDSVGANYLNFLMPTIEEARVKGVMTQDSAIMYLSRLLNVTFNQDFQKQSKDIHLKYVKDILNRELFPHIGQTSRKKAFFLGYMTRRLIDCYFGLRPYDDRDHYSNKRVNLSGPLLNDIFRYNFINLVKALKQQILPKLSTDTAGLVSSLRKIIQSCGVESKLKYALATGNWSTQKNAISASKKGIAQVLNRLSAIGALSHTRRVQSPLERAGSKIVAPRRLHGTHFGMCCPNETPEGAQVGIVKNFAMQTHVTIQTSDYPIRMALTQLGVKDLNETHPLEVSTSVKVFVNGDWFGVISETLAKKLYDQLKTLKRHGIIVPYIAISWQIEAKEIIIQTDGGRYSRPLYVVENNRLLIAELFDTNPQFRQDFQSGSFKWMNLLAGFYDKSDLSQIKLGINNGAVVEYLDTDELETAMVAMTISDLKANDVGNSYYMYYSHCEIHPMMMMGVTATMIPFSDHNQSPRNCYQCLWLEEKVLMADGHKKAIKDIRVGEEVVTIDPKTCQRSTSKVINQYVKPTEKLMYELTLISGRKVVATEDHPILTYKGWKPLGKLTKGDLVCVCPPDDDVDHGFATYCLYPHKPQDSLEEWRQRIKKYAEQETYSYEHGVVSSEYQRTQVIYPQMSYIEWQKIVKMKGKSIFVPVKSKVVIPNALIADISIESECHSFVTGDDICVHNSSMGKQAIGYYVTNYNSRMETLANVLVYGHRPLVATRTMKYVFIDKLPHGETAMLLYACYSYNQEDSVVVNADAVNRGFMNTIYFRTYKDKEQKHKSSTTATERFLRPTKANTRDLKHGSYHAVDDNGIPKLGAVTEGGDVIIGKVIESKDADALGRTYKDASTIVRANEHGTIDMVIPNGKIHNYNAEGNRFVAARVSNLRKPELGDKFASRYAQKGTTGMLYSQVDMPFSCYGLVPDIIINSHGIPSRMTVNKLIETLLGRVSLCTGQVQDATPFSPFDLKSFTQILKSYGCHDMGYDVFYNGEMGNMYKVEFFYGPTYYQRLKHMTADKYHARLSGPVQLLTRQPTEGRSRDGGLRAGEMEVQAFYAHGVAKYLKEKITDDSDLFQVFLSKKHEAMIVGNPDQQIFKYNGKTLMDDEVVALQLPYAMYLLWSEIQSMGIDVRIGTS